MNNFIRPYKNLTEQIDNSFNDTKYIIKKNNFWEIKNCKNIIVFGEDTIKIIKENYYDNKTNFIYTFAIYRNFLEKLNKNESLYYLQPDPQFIFSKVKSINPNTKNWLAFYSNEIQKKYLLEALKLSKSYQIKLKIILTSKDTNLNSFIEKSSYDTFWFIPDSLYSTSFIVEYIIEKLIILKKFSIGFNNFFYKSGATLSFDIDYKKTANFILENLQKKEHGYFSFKYKILINKKNLKYLQNELK